MSKYALSMLIAAALTMTLSLSAQALAGSEGPGPALEAASIPTTVVEMPQELLKVWAESGVKGATLLLIGSDPGVSPIPDAILPLVDELMAKRDWENLLIPDYPTPRAYPILPFNYISAAHRAGMIERVYWVPPTKKPVGEEDFGSFSGFLRDSGVSDSDIAALKLSDYAMEGSLNGVPFYICSIKDLPKIKDDTALLFDLSFFADTYENEVKTPFLDIFGGTVEIIGRRVPNITGAVVSYSTMMGPTPLSIRFAGRYLEAWLTSPDHLKAGPPRHWEMRAQAMYYDTFFQTEDALDSYMDAVEAAPDDASLHYDLARTLDRMKALDPLKDEIDKAVQLDPGYYPQYLAFSRTFLDNDVPWAAEVCVKDAIRINPDDPRNYDALREVYDRAKLYDKAAECVEKVIGMGFGMQENYGLLGVTYTKAGRYAESAKAFEKAVSLVREDDSVAMAALMQGLADAYAGDKKIEKALETYRLAEGYAADPHEKMLIFQKAEALRRLWEPFMGGGPAPGPPRAPERPSGATSPSAPPR